MKPKNKKILGVIMLSSIIPLLSGVFGCIAFGAMGCLAGIFFGLVFDFFIAFGVIAVNLISD